MKSLKSKILMASALMFWLSSAALDVIGQEQQPVDKKFKACKITDAEGTTIGYGNTCPDGSGECIPNPC